MHGTADPASQLRIFLLVTNDLFDTDGRLNGDNNTVFATVPSVANFFSESFREGWEVEIGLLVSTFIHQSQFISFTNINDFPVALVDNGDSGSVSRWNHIFQLLSGENVHGREVTFCVSVLSSLGDRDIEDLAWISLDHHKPKGKKSFEYGAAKTKTIGKQRDKRQLGAANESLTLLS